MNQFKILFVQDKDMINEISYSDDESNKEEYHEESTLIQAIQNKLAIAACNSSVENSVMAG